MLYTNCSSSRVKSGHAALADGLDNLGRDTELERVGLVDEPGILRGGETRGDEKIINSSKRRSRFTREANISCNLSVFSHSSVLRSQTAKGPRIWPRSRISRS